MYLEKDFITTSPYGSNARGWINEPSGWLEDIDETRTLLIGFYEAWKAKPTDFYVYSSQDELLPIFEATDIYDQHFKELYGYSACESRARDHSVANKEWKFHQKKRLDAKISQLQYKRRKIDEL